MSDWASAATTVGGLIGLALAVATIAIYIIALGVLPGGRRPQTAMAWLLLIFMIPWLGFLLFLLYEWIIDPLGLYGIGLSNISSIIFMLAMYALAAILYFGFKAYRKRQGIDIDKVYEEIPVE